MRRALWITTLLLVAGCTGGGETVVSGIGNSGNRIRTDAVVDDVAHALAEQPGIPEVLDDDVLAAYESIRARAREGELQATLVLLELAALQRE
jgi:hypothetical protein